MVALVLRLELVYSRMARLIIADLEDPTSYYRTEEPRKHRDRRKNVLYLFIYRWIIFVIYLHYKRE